MKHHTQRGALALIALLVVIAMVGGGPTALMGAVQAQPVVPAGGMAALGGPELSAALERFWAIGDNNTTGASLAVDANGGVHAAMSGFTPLTDTTIYPVYYGYCAADCAGAGSWAWTIVGQVGLGASDVAGVRLALDPQGRPRIMWFYLAGPIGDDPGYWEYAECDDNCLENASWTVVDVVTVNPVASPGDGHYFALDHLGRPRFIYREIDAYAGRTGTYYRYCDADCTEEGTWFERRINTELLYDPSLAFTSTGQPRIAYRTGDQLAYVESSNGGQTWSGDLFYTLGSGATFTLRLDAQNRPRDRKSVV